MALSGVIGTFWLLVVLVFGLAPCGVVSASELLVTEHGVHGAAR